MIEAVADLILFACGFAFALVVVLGLLSLPRNGKHNPQDRHIKRHPHG